MGVVYEAHDLKRDKTVALKTLINAEPSYIYRLKTEFRSLSDVAHPNLVSLYELMSDGKYWFFTMELVNGVNFLEYVRSGRSESGQSVRSLEELDTLETLPLPVSKQIQSFNEGRLRLALRQLAEGLNALHENGKLHRDIKPSNLKLMPHGLIKLVDFGLVKILAPEEVTITIIQGQGTALYTPLEQYGGSDVHTDIRSDIYSFGATLYHLLTNEAPADARKRFLQPDSLVPLRQINPEISQRTERAILWAMALHPDERPATINDFRQALLGFREPSTHPLTKRPVRRQSIWEYLAHPPEATLAWSAAVLLLVSLLATLAR